MSESKGSGFSDCVPFQKVVLHNSMCRGCASHRPVCNRVLFGGQPPTDCPYVLEHIVGDQDFKDEEAG